MRSGGPADWVPPLLLEQFFVPCVNDLFLPQYKAHQDAGFVALFLKPAAAGKHRRRRVRVRSGVSHLLSAFWQRVQGRALP